MTAEVALYSPGLKRMKRHNGRIDLYWVADEKLVAKSYPTKTVRIPSDMPPEGIAARCQILQQEMLEWAGGLVPSKNSAVPGTLEWVCRAFETDADSPYHDRRQATRVFYSKYIRTLVDTAGHMHLADILGRDVRRWHKDWSASTGERSAYACIQTLRRVVSYGCELRNADAIELAAVLERTEFPMPRKRKHRPTFEQIVALRRAAHAADRPSIALAVALQFELGLRQKDVIGEWVRPTPAQRSAIAGAIADGVWVWQWGLTWNHINAEHLLEKPTSKSNGQEVAAHDLRLHPEILSELPPRGVGPVVIDERSKLPWKATHFSHTFRKIARAAGWPGDLWNMDSRAGAVSEDFEAGADATDVMRTATHTQMSTTMIYNRGGVVQSSRVAELRAARRKGREQC
ncbi:integrase [Methylobacterium sp. 092160098-2]|uniref:integrase n=1 Tax=Methylobacterium sp. 092160098-2 TaxID=3025129 RepID=UPI0023819E83|nr:integrase [Methylobacterium sp. 092160098-2]MDE4912779.1 integrase [Methylobacterium sp. 092160098-2]